MNDLTEAQSLQLAVERYERSYIAKIFEKNNFNKTKTAKELKISIRSLYYKLEKHQLE